MDAPYIECRFSHPFPGCFSDPKAGFLNLPRRRISWNASLRTPRNKKDRQNLLWRIYKFEGTNTYTPYPKIPNTPDLQTMNVKPNKNSRRNGCSGGKRIATCSTILPKTVLIMISAQRDSSGFRESAVFRKEGIYIYAHFFEYAGFRYFVAVN